MLPPPRGSVHSCDLTVGGVGGVCATNNLKDKCTMIAGVKTCCCDGDL